MKPFIMENWHAWESNGSILLSNEVLKKLYSFNGVDNAVNWLAVHGRLAIAKALNKHAKGS